MHELSALGPDRCEGPRSPAPFNQDFTIFVINTMYGRIESFKIDSVFCVNVPQFACLILLSLCSNSFACHRYYTIVIVVCLEHR